MIRQKGFVGILQIFVRFLSKFERFNIFFKLMYYFFYVVSEFCNDFIRSFKGFVKILLCLFFIRFKYGREIFELGKHSAVHYYFENICFKTNFNSKYEIFRMCDEYFSLIVWSDASKSRIVQCWMVWNHARTTTNQWSRNHTQLINWSFIG